MSRARSPLFLGVLVFSVMAGFAIGFDRLSIVVLVLLIGIGVVAHLALVSRAYLVGILIVGYMNGLPFLDFTNASAMGLRADDLFLASLLVLSTIWSIGWRDRGARRYLRTAILVFGAVWALTVLATPAVSEASLLGAGLFGRDLLALFATLAVAAACRDSDDLVRVTQVIVGASLLYSVAHMAQVLIGFDTGFITHPYIVSDTLGLTRLYARFIPMTTAGLALAAGRAFWSADSIERGRYGLASFILVVEIILQLTRANYVGMLIAAAVGLWLLVRFAHDRLSIDHVAALFFVLGALIVGVWISLDLPSVNAWWSQSAIGLRISSTSTDLGSLGGTLGYRLLLLTALMEVLAGRWLFGVGFLHPGEHYVSTLPSGSIRNTDTGIFAVLMPMGIVGVLATVAPLALSAHWGFRLVSNRSGMACVGWSAVIYSAWVVATMPTLGYLSFGPGLMTTAVVVGVCAAAYDLVFSAALDGAKA